MIPYRVSIWGLYGDPLLHSSEKGCISMDPEFYNGLLLVGIGGPYDLYTACFIALLRDMRDGFVNGMRRRHAGSWYESQHYKLVSLSTVTLLTN